MGRCKATNNALTTLAAAFTAGVSTTLTVLTGKGALFPTPTADRQVRLVLTKASAVNTIGQITDATKQATYLAETRTGDVFSDLTFESGDDELSFAIGDHIGALWTAEAYEEFDEDLTAVEMLAAGHTTTLASHTSSIATNATAITARLVAANNLSDLANAATARDNLGVTSQLALKASGRGVFFVSSYMSASRLAGTGAGVVDDLIDFKEAVDACMAAGGGEVVVDVPLWFLGASAGYWDALPLDAENIVIRGRGTASVITVLAPTIIPISFVNFNIATFVDLVFVGGGVAAAIDCDILLYASGWEVNIDRCVFANVRAGREVISLPSTTGTITRCLFGGTGSANGPGMVKAHSGSRLLFHESKVIDYVTVDGVTYGGRTNPLMPWIYYSGNGSAATGGRTGGAANSIGLHVRNAIMDEGCSFQVVVVKENAGGLPIRAVVFENFGVNIGSTGAFNVSGVDSFVVLGGDICLSVVNPAVILRGVRSARFERVFATTGGTCEIDADATVASVELVECVGLTKAAGYAATRTLTIADGLTTVQSGSSTVFQILSTGRVSAPGAGTDSERFGVAAVAGNFAASFGHTANAGIQSVAFGNGASAPASSSAALGNAAIAGDLGTTVGASSRAGILGVAIGVSANANTGQGSIAIGASATTTTDAQLVIGSGSGPIADAHFGKGVTHATPTGITFHATGGSGSNVAGANYTIAPGQGTGTGAGGSFIVQVAPAGSSGASLNALIDAFTIASTGQVTIPIANVRDAADDAAAAALSPAVPIGGLYRTGSQLKIRAS